jgi:hypothetical protein
MMSWIQNRYTARRHPGMGMRGVAYAASLSSSPTNVVGGTLGRKDTRFEDSRYIRF